MHKAATHSDGFPDLEIEIADDAIGFWAQVSEGDARRILTAFELAVLSTEPSEDSIIRIDLNTAEESMQQKAIVYGDDGHYDTISAFIKSMRGSDPDASIYWLAKMVSAGEDLRFIGRRMVIFASEDIGNADPRALSMALDAMQAVEKIGMPEGRIILSQVVAYLATAPKSNASVKAIDRAMADIREGRTQAIPLALRDAHYKSATRLGHGEGYKYPHDYPYHYVKQDYLTEERQYYVPGDLGFEKKIKERMNFLKNLKDDSTDE